MAVRGVRVLTEQARAAAESTAAQGGVRGALARVRVATDDQRRVTARRRVEDHRIDGGFDRELAAASPRGYTGAGGGRIAAVPMPPEWRGTTVQVAGLYPWCVGAAAPAVGTPVGRHLITGAPVHFDPMRWFKRGFVTAPSAFVLALNGFGKSSLIRRLVTGAVAAGDTALILGDTKGEYTRLAEVLGGQVVTLGYGHGTINPLSIGAGLLRELTRHQTDPQSWEQALTRVRTTQVTVVAALIELVRGSRCADFEELILTAAITELGRRGFGPDRPPLLSDLLAVVADADALQAAAEEDTPQDYRAATKPLRRSLRALVEGPLASLVNGHTTHELDPDAPAVVIDVSRIPSGDSKSLAAAMLLAWAGGFGAIADAHVLADAGLSPKRTYTAVLDEIWRVLALGEAMVGRVDALTRLNRELGASVIMCSHSLADLEKRGALGFFERSRAKLIGPIGPQEVERVRSCVTLTQTEAALVTSWAAPRPPGDDTAFQQHDRRETPPGTGCFLLTTGEGESPGIPFRLEFTDAEHALGVHNTNRRFDFDDDPAPAPAGRAG
ncbi:hypothetical protein IU487_33665 [Nocardia puris]|uniref:hypothetical protein n=1 Tax=Nocardia puris TaxID=208602 RepID=UPI0018962C9E|nr:hypothetical protein [Nocardia puris]MBF6215949.1 hypothetical protein [Nocardia puris]